MSEEFDSSKLIGFVVIEKKQSHEPRGMGFHRFHFAPRVGEFITLNDEEGRGQAYRVKALFHPLDPLEDSAGDLIVEHAGHEIDVIMAL